MPSLATTPRRMEALARALDRAAASAIVPRPRIDQLRTAFMATDAQGRSWTIDPEFQRWGRLDGERWMVDDPPPQLFMDSELRASLEGLEAMAARAIVTGADGLQGPRTPWFRGPVAAAEPPGLPASIPSRESVTASPPPLNGEPAPVTEPARSVESLSPLASAPRETVPARTATVDPVVEPVPIASVMSPEVSYTAEPAASAIPEAHLRFARPGIALVPDGAETPVSATTTAPAATPAPDRILASAESPASVPPRDASHDRERWVPTSIAPRLTDEHPETRDDRAPVVLCGVLATLFVALAVWKDDGRGYAAGVLFGLLAVTLLVLNLVQSRHD